MLCIAAIVLLALNLRPAMAVIGPLLDLIQAATGATHVEAGLLTTLPFFVMGLCALFGASLRRRLGDGGGVAIGATMILLACLARASATGRTGLIATAAIAGLGVALAQTLLPSFIKRRFPGQFSRVMGVYTTGIMAGAAIAAASAASLAQQFGWPAALAIWSVPAAAAVLLWSTQLSRVEVRTEAASALRPYASPFAHAPFSGNVRAWELLVFFGVGTGAFTLALAWLPPFYIALGWSRADAGLLLSGLTLAEVAAGLVVSAFIGRFPDRRGPLVVSLGFLFAGLCCLVVAPLSLAIVAAILLGLGLGALFPLSLILTLDHIDDPTRAGDLAAFVQGGGYMVASLTPLLAGYLRDRSADLSQAWIVMAAGALLQIAMAAGFSPASYARLEEPAPKGAKTRHGLL